MKKASIALYTLVLCTSSNSVSTISMSALHKHSMHYCFCAGKGLYSPLHGVLCTSPNSMHIHPGDTSYTLWTLTMGIRVLLNPFSTERLTRQRLLNALQQTEDYIMSQQVLYNDSLNTCNQDTVLYPMHSIEDCPMLHVCQNSVASGRDKALSHRSVPLWKWSPRLLLASACLLNKSHPNWIRWYQAETYSKEYMRGAWYGGKWYGNDCAIQKTVQGYQKWQKVANNGLVGAASRGMNADGYIGMPSRHAMLSKQWVLYTQLPTLVLGSSKQ